MRFLAIFLISTTALCQEAKSLRLFGETNYSQSQDKALGTNLNGEYRVVIHEPKHKDYIVYLGGKVVLDYDHFGNEIKTNAFTTLGVDF
jgi:hypothetical protein